jgi:sugar phosphate isomerase/epimerase
VVEELDAMPIPRFSLSHLSALDSPPAELVSLASRTGYWAVGLRLHPAAPGALCYAMTAGSPALQDVKARMRDTGVRIYDVEFVPLTPDLDIRSLLPTLETAAELGAERLNVSGDDADFARLSGKLAGLAELANEYGLTVDLEFMRWRAVGTLAQAIDVARHSGAANVSVLLDALHLFRSGGRVSDVSKLPLGMTRAVQLCDAPRIGPSHDSGLMDEARGRRLAPGLGELPVRALVESLPDDIDMAVEVPLPLKFRENRLAHLQVIREGAEELFAPEQVGRRAGAQ